LLPVSFAWVVPIMAEAVINRNATSPYFIFILRIVLSDDVDIGVDRNSIRVLHYFERKR